jgi:hypothetical protein
MDKLFTHINELSSRFQYSANMAHLHHVCESQDVPKRLMCAAHFLWLKLFVRDLENCKINSRIAQPIATRRFVQALLGFPPEAMECPSNGISAGQRKLGPLL